MLKKAHVKKGALLAFFFFLLTFITACSTPYLNPTDKQIVKKAKGRLLNRGKTKKYKTIILDPGHGGEDLGAIVKKPKVIYEKSICLQTAQLLKRHLKHLGYRVIMTRNKDYYIPLDDRVSMGDQAGDALFVSLHYNSAPNRRANGIEVYYYQPRKKTSKAQRSKKLAQSILDHAIYFTKASSRGIKKGNFKVIRNGKVPAILLEGGFITNQYELNKLNSPNYLNNLSWGVAQGIDYYLHHL